MDRVFETTVDSQGHFDIPIDMRERHGLTNGARVNIEERANEVVITPARDELDRKRKSLAAIDRAVGFLGNDGAVLKAFMDERKAQRERENRAFST